MNIQLLKHCRQLAELNQSELAKRVQVDQSLISKIEAGTIPIHEETERKVREVFKHEGITAEYIKLLSELFEAKTMKKQRKEWQEVR
ncbi:helix-turn-helix domain-containing protein [Halobacillus andaensis]|nr:helix-turn-helix domain-containing protein [Halobacillus andaensis]